MLALTGLCGERLRVDADLIQAVEGSPCTVVVMADGSCVEVSEQVAEVAERVTRYRAALLAAHAEVAPDAPLADIKPLPLAR
ncbi:MAG TPA: flagellar FlbD family protein [Acidimicrobiales bacterium]|nr:flagellar FlbD family protein [Acidimicrobiales bacterium]